MNIIKLFSMILLVTSTLMSGCSSTEKSNQQNITILASHKPAITNQPNLISEIKTSTKPQISTKSQTTVEPKKQKVTPEEAKKLILKFRDFKIEELILEKIDPKTGEYYITRSPGKSKGAAGVTYIVNPVTGDVVNYVTKKKEFNLFLNDIVREISPEEIKNYFLDSKEVLLKKLGNSYETVQAGAEGSLQGYYYKELGLTFIFDDNNRVNNIQCDSNFHIKGVKAGMLFSEIKQKLGNTTLNKTWIETPDNKAYDLKYNFDGFILRVLSLSIDGKDSTISILRK